MDSQPSPQQSSNPSSPAPEATQAEAPAPSSNELITGDPAEDVIRQYGEQRREQFRQRAEQEASENGESPEQTEPPADDKQSSKTSESPSPAGDTADKQHADKDRVKPSQWAQFHREQTKFFEQRQQHQAELAEARKLKETFDNAKTDRLAALEMLGYTDIKEFVEGLAEDGGRMTPERRELQELQKWRKEQERQNTEMREQREREAQQQAANAKLDGLRTNIQNRLDEHHKDKIVHLKGANEQVLLEMDKMASETGEMPDIDAAIQRVEAQYTTFLGEMAENPAIVDFFKNKWMASQSPQRSARQSKSRASEHTITGNAAFPGTHRANGKGAAADDWDLEDGLAFLSRGRAR